MPTPHLPSCITLLMNGKTFECSFKGDKSFMSELNRAQLRGHNPAEALVFLAQMAASKCHPHHTPMSPTDEARWKELFG